MRKTILIYLFLFLGVLTVNSWSFTLPDSEPVGCPTGTYASIPDARLVEEGTNTINGETCILSSLDNWNNDSVSPYKTPFYYGGELRVNVLGCSEAWSDDTVRYQYWYYPCKSLPVCTEPQINNPDSSDHECIDPPILCDEGMHDEGGVCVCDSEYVPNQDGVGCSLPPDCSLDDPNSVYDPDTFQCVCDENMTKSPFTGLCISSDPVDPVDPDDIDGDGIPNDQDDDIDGDGIPNDQDSTPNGGDGGGDSNDPIPNQCEIADINSQEINGQCFCKTGYHKDITDTCVADEPITHDPRCDYPATKGGYPFQDTTFTLSGCQYYINFFGGGDSDKLSTCDYYGCYFSKDGTGDGNNTTPGDLDGDGIPDDQDDDIDGDGIDNNASNTDYGLFSKVRDTISNASGQNVDLNVKASSSSPITFSIMGHTYVLYDPAMISDDVWNTIALVMKWTAIISAIFTVFMTI